MANQQSSKRPEPGDGPFNDPALAVDAQPPAIFVGPVNSIVAVRTDERDAPSGQLLTQRIAVVAAVADQAVRFAVPGRYARGERLLDERDLGRRGRGEAYSQRKTLTLHQYHALCTFPPLGGTDVRAPFFAEAKVPSMNAVSHASRPRASSSVRNARQMRSHVPSSSQRLSRRQHVAGLGYSVGRSHHRAPVFSTQRMPSITARLPIHGRPPRRLRGSRGRSGSILAHCASVTRTLRLATSATSGQCGTAAREKVQVLIASVRRL